MPAEIAMLQEAPMFALLDQSELQAVSEMLDHRRFDKGATLFSYGDAGDCIYILRSGRVQVYVENTEGEKIILAEYEPGDSFGEISLLDGGPRTATAVAIDDSEALTFDRENLLDFVRQHPDAALDMLTAMGKRLRATDELLRTHVSRNINEEEEERLTFGQRIADRVASFGGSWTFIIFFGFVLVAWMSINAYVLAGNAFDPFPFILLNLALSALAALQAPVIMMSQNRQAAKDRLKADLEYQVNLKAELEVAQLHNKVDRIYEEMQAQFAKLNGREKKPAGMGQ